MKDSSYITVSIDDRSLLVSLIGFWYKENSVFDRLEDIAKTVNTTEFAESFHDLCIGRILMKHGNLEEEFVEFTKSHNFGNFGWNILPHSKLVNASERIALDLARKFKETNWWAQNKAALIREKKKLKAVREVMSE